MRVWGKWDGMGMGWKWNGVVEMEWDKEKHGLEWTRVQCPGRRRLPDRTTAGIP